MKKMILLCSLFSFAVNCRDYKYYSIQYFLRDNPDLQSKWIETERRYNETDAYKNSRKAFESYTEANKIRAELFDPVEQYYKYMSCLNQHANRECCAQYHPNLTKIELNLEDFLKADKLVRDLWKDCEEKSTIAEQTEEYLQSQAIKDHCFAELKKLKDQ